jgi:RNA polymerase sigma factor (TIGR02999 family)
MGESDITQLLEQWRLGDESAFDAIAPAVYGQLHQVAAGYIRGEYQHRTLQATALVNEVFLKLLQTNKVQFASRKHFFTFAAKLMRRILIDHARRKLTQKRGLGQQRVELSPELAWIDAASPEMLDLDRSLDELAAEEPDLVRILEVRFFLGASASETAELLGASSRSSVDRDIAFAVSWLHRRLRGTPSEQIPHR